MRERCPARHRRLPARRGEAMTAKFRGVTTSAVPALAGRVVDFLGYSAAYPWVRAVDTGETFVWREEQIRPLTGAEAQLTMFEKGATP